MPTKRWTIFFSLLAALLTILTLSTPPALAQGPDSADSGKRPVRIARILLRIAAEEIGLTPRELFEELRQDGGRSIAEVANDHGVSPDSIVEAFMDKASEKSAQLVDKGHLTQEEADEKLATVRERVTEFINKRLPPRFQGDRPEPEKPNNE